MIKLAIDSSDLKKLERVQAKLPQAIARGMNESGDKVRTQVQHALQRQTSLVRYSSVVKRTRTARAFADGLSYSIIVSGKPPTKPSEFRVRVQTGPGGGVTIWMWGVAHKFKRSFQQKIKGGLRMRLDAARLPVRGFDGPNLAKEVIKDETARAFFETAAAQVAPIVEKHLGRLFR